LKKFDPSRFWWISNGMQLAAQIDNTSCLHAALLDLVPSQPVR